MMRTKALLLTQQRDVLVSKIRAERVALARQSAALRPAAKTVDRVNAGIRYVRSHPEIMLLPLTLLTLWRPQRLIAFAMSGIGFWRFAQGALQRLRPVSQHEQ